MNLMTKLCSIFMGHGASGGLSLVSVLGSTVNTDEVTVDVNVMTFVVDAIASMIFKVLYAIVSFILMILDFIQIMVYRLMGVGEVMGGDYVVFDQNNPLIKFMTNDVVLDAFAAVLVVAVIFIIVFTIFSIIISEYKAATGDGENTKSRILGRSLRSFLMLTLFPAVLIGGIVLVNALLAGFNNVFNSDIGRVPSLGNTVFMSSVETSNMYRNYAANGNRIPILFDFEDPYENGQTSGYTTDELLTIYENFKDYGKSTYEYFAYGNFPTFKDTLTYDPSSKKVYNSSSYVGYEKFHCTPEQYAVMGDFVKYAFSTGLQFSIKSIKDDDIEWKYVDSAIFDKESTTLSITYKNAYGTAGDDEFYTIEYCPTSLDVTTPISDAFDAISNILAIGDYADNEFDILERDDDSINVVFWENDKALIRLSDNYKTNPTYMDLILLFEFFRFDYNNTLDCTLSELEKGITLPVLEYERREWRADLLKYVTTGTDTVVEINGSYYKVVPTNTSGKIEINKVDEDGKPIKDEFGSNIKEVIDTSGILSSYTNANGAKELANARDSYNDYYYMLVPIEVSVCTPSISDTIDETVGEGNSIKVEGIFASGSEIQYINYRQGITFEDVRVEKLNGSYELITELPDGTGVVSYAFYADRVTEINKKVNWPQKLIGDMQTIYSDINMNLLITSGDWLTALSEIVGSTASSGDYGQTFDTSLIHPLGLMISELFLNEIHEDNENKYGEYEFASSLSEQEIRSLLLAIAGEENYYQLSSQIEYFVEIFNAFMEPVLEDIAFRENFELADGKGYSEQLYTYKAYLCSVLLSSACAEYLFDATIAIVGASDFSYDLLKYGDIVKVAYEEVIEDINHGRTPSENPSTDTGRTVSSITNPIFVHVVISKDEYAAASGLGGNGDFDNIISLDDKEMTYAQFKSKYAGIGKLFDQESGYDAVLEAIKENFSFDEVKNYKLLEEVIAKLMDCVVIVPSIGSMSEVENIVSSVYKSSTELKTYCSYHREEDTCYYIGSDASGKVGYLTDIYNKIIEEMEDLGFNTSNPNYEYAVTLKNYIAGKIARWDFVQNVDLDGVNNLVGTLSDLNDSASQMQQSMGFAVLSSKFLDDIEFLQMCLNEIDSNDSAFPDFVLKTNLSIEDFLGTINGMINDADVIDLNLINMVLDSDKKMISKLKAVMEVANSTDEKAVKATWLLEQIRDYIQEYTTNLADYDHESLKTYLKDENAYTYEDDLKRCMNGISDLSTIGLNIDSYLDTLEKIDKLNKYYITYSVTSYVSTHINTEFDVVVNSKHYTVGSNFTSNRLAEYVLGGKFLKSCGYDVVFVDEDYEGFLSIEVPENTAPEIKTYTLDKLQNSFTYLRDFLCEFGEATVNIYNITNFGNLAENKNDELVIGNNDKLMQILLEWCVDSGYLTDSVIIQRFGLADWDFAGTGVEAGSISAKAKYVIENTTELEDLFETVLGYLFITDANDVDLASMTLKQLRTKAIQKLANYETPSADSKEQNQNRFLALFAIACLDWEQTGENDGEYNAGEETSITGVHVSASSQSVVLKLAGIENRPYEELIDLEYSIDFEIDSVDEANGDIFVVCTYDEDIHRYVPFMMTNSTKATGASLKVVDGVNWLEKYKFGKAITDAYINPYNTEAEVFFPVIARGIFDSNGNPTAIRKVGEDVEFYREDVVIRNASDIGLKTYYVQIEQARTKGGIFGVIADWISQAATGKTLAQNILGSIPRVDVTSKINLPYGVADHAIGNAIEGNLTLSFSFGGTSLDFSAMFEQDASTILLLLFVAVVIFMIIGKAVYGCIGRLLDITVLFILGPVAISTVSVKTDKRGKDGNYEEDGSGMSGIYDNWKKTLIEKILLAFGYVFGLNIFYMLEPMVVGNQLFASNEAFATIPLFGDIPLALLNVIGSLIMLVTLSSLVTYAPALFSKIMDVTTSDMDAFAYGSTIKAQAKNVVREVGDTLSGQRFLDAAKDLKDTAKGFVPLSAVREKFKERKKKKEQDAKLKSMKADALAAGVDPATAEKAIQAYKQADAKKKEIEKKKKDADAKAKKGRDKMRDSGYTE